MNDGETAVANMFIAMDEFTDERIAEDFSNLPPKPVDLKIKAASLKLKAAITDLGGKAAIQAGNEFEQETEQKTVLVEELEDEMRLYNKTAASIAAETKNPGLMDRFRLPHGSSVTQVKAKGTSFATAIRDLGLNAEFEAHGYSADAAADMDALVAGVQAGQAVQAGALSKRVGAGKAVPEIITDGKGAVKTIDAICSKKYKGDAEMLGRLKTATHVRKTGARKNGGTPPPPVTPP